MLLNRAFVHSAGRIARVSVKPGFPALWAENCSIREVSVMVTAGANNTTHVGVSYNSLRIQGYAYGSHGLGKGLSNDPDDCIFPNVSLETEFGNTHEDQGPHAADDGVPSDRRLSRKSTGIPLPSAGP